MKYKSHLRAFLLLFLLTQVVLTLRQTTDFSSSTRVASNQAPTLAQKVAFLAYTAKFSKSYQSTTEFTKRFQLWLDNDKYIKGFTNSQVQLQHNKFSDWTPEERNRVLNSKLADQITLPKVEKLSRAPFMTNDGFADTTTPLVGQASPIVSAAACPVVGCKTCATVNTNFCTSCNSAKMTINTKNVCVCTTGPMLPSGADCSTCPTGQFYQNYAACVSCGISNCNSCTSTTKCTACASPFVVSGGLCVCPTGTMLSSSLCVACPANCTACGSTGCTACSSATMQIIGGACVCPSGTVLNSTGVCATALTCPTGTYNLANVCTACPNFCSACINATVCTACSDPSFHIVNVTDVQVCRNCDTLFQNVKVGLCRCQPETYLSGGKCVNIGTCSTPSTYNSGSTNVCTACAAGCSKCYSFTGWCYETTDPSVLINATNGQPYCLPTQYFTGTQCITITQCPQAQWNDGRNVCAACPRNCSICANLTGTCLNCSSTFTMATGSTTCGCLSNQFMDVDTSTNTGNCITKITCPSGQYNPGWNNCTNCVANCQTCSDVTGQCTQCKATYTQTGNSCACNPDPTQQFLNTTSQLCVNITSCPAGQYNDGQNTCTNCPLNCSSCAFRTGACSACATGFVSNAGQTGCNCVSGKYWTSNNSTGTCAACPTNCPTCSDLSGACLTCVNNLTVVTGSPDTCGCPVGQYLSGSVCLTCAANCTACATGTGACTNCTSTFSLSSGACTCNEALQTLISGQCVSILACNNGYYNPGNNTCQLGPGNCNTVTYRTGVCTNCNPTFTYFSNNNTCGCAAGFYLSSLGICQACPQNCSYCTSPTACTACKTTFTLTSGACGCVANTQAYVGGSSCATLSTCAAAQYNDGTNTCQPCSNTLNYCGTCSAYTGYCTACLSSFQNNTSAVNGAGVTVMTACNCYTGQYLNTTSKACIACPQNCTACDATGACTSCMNNLTLTSGVCACAANQLFLNNACQNYATCYATTAGSGGGYYANTANVCTAPIVQYCLNSTAITGVCTQCQSYGTAGALTLNAAAQTCKCPLSNQYIGTYSGGTDAYCYSCSSTIGCQNCTTSNVCMSCVQGYYLSGTTCNLCTALSHCTACTQAYGAAVQCTACNQGWILQSGTCVCPVGYYQDCSYNCIVCPAGWNCGSSGCRGCWDYNDGNYLGACNNCDNGWTTNNYVNYNRWYYTCTCPGQYYPGSNFPVPNKPYSATVATKRCEIYTTCPNGQYNNYVDNACRNCADPYCPSCQNPGVNQYTQNGVCVGCINSLVFNGTACVCPNPAGNYRTTSFTCAACPTNCATCADGTGICTACNTGFILPTPNTSPTACVCNTTGNVLVLITTVTPNTCVTATVCSPGQYNIGGSVTSPNTCAKCPTSNCQTCTFGTGACTACNTTFVTNAAVATTAVNYCVCAAGQYQIASGFCVNCPANCSACANLTGQCTACSHASFGSPVNGACVCPSTAPALASGQCAAMTSCGTGRYNDGTNTCLNCPANCNTCSNYAGVCQTGGCVTSFTLNTTANTCTCLSNQRLSSGACVNCPANCTLCDSTGQCTACVSTYTLTSGACACTSTQAQVSGACTTLNSCPSGQYNPGNNVCTNCPSPYCATCTAFTGVCTACNATFQSPTTSLTSACACLSTQYVTALTTCAACPRNCLACNSAGACTSCNTTFTIVSGQCACQTTEYLTTSNVCATCPTNCTSCSDLTAQCQTCRSGGFTVNTTGSCTCPSATPAVTTSGTVCAALSACTTVTNGVGQYNDGTNTCRSCPAYCTSCDSYSGQCNTCFSSFTWVSASNTCACTSSQYLTASNTCASCPANCTTCAASTGYCNGCVASYSSRSNGCSCNPTTEAQVTTLGVTTCVALTTCSDGQYNPGNNVCTNCPDQYCRTCNAYTGACNACKTSFTVSSGSCVCSANQYINSDGVCTNCPLNCTTCTGPTGTCTACTSTFTLNTPSAGMCGCASPNLAVVTTSGVRSCAAMTACSTTTTPPQYNPGTNVCANCPTNSLGCADWTGTITSCKASFTNNNPTANTCTCLSNQYVSSSNQCVNCPANCTTCAASTGYCNSCVSTYSVRSNGCSCNPTTEALVTTNGVSSCTTLATCASGQYNPGNNVCTNCPTQNCAACDAYTGQCSQCATSYSLTGAFACACTSSQFLNTTTNRCQACPQNCTTCSATACTACASTFGSPSAGVCQCAATQYLIRATGQCTTITTCSAGQYNDGQNNCLACSANCTSCTAITGLCTSTSCVSTFTFNTASQTCTCTQNQALVTNGATGVSSCQSITTCPNGQFNPGTNICRVCPANCTLCLSPTGICTACATGFTLNSPKSGSCGCRLTQAYVNGQCTALTQCTKAGTYNPGTNKCQDCPANCTACTTPTGACTACQAGFTWNVGIGTCSCKSTQAYMQQYGCVPLYACPPTTYNPGNNQCTRCSANCVACADFTARCTACGATFTLQNGTCVAARRILDQDCKYAVGPVGNATICLSEPASDTRVVPEFNKTEEQVDWRTWGIVGGVKDQGTCGGDFAFSTAAAAEAAYAIKTGKLFDLSEQYLIDCDVGSFGCQGGFQSSSSLLLATDGAVLEDDYPYVGKQTGCRSNVVKKVFQLKYPGSEQVTSSKDAFKAQLRKGPLNVSFRVSDLSFFFYGNGILPAELCKDGKLNHAMLAVGFGVEDSIEYALIQNQWGAGWGENGLLRVELTDDSEGPCGLYLQNSYTLV